MKHIITFKRKVRTVIRNPKSILFKLLYIMSPLMSDKFYLSLLFPLSTGYSLDLENPKSYNEKLQWLKLNYRNPELTKMVDKYEAKKHVETLIGSEHIIPTLGVWKSFEEIDFGKLPCQFVLKTTHDQGGVVICKNKELFAIDQANKKLNKHLKTQHYYLSREWPYKNLEPRIIAEKYMEDKSTNDLVDYKFFCFHGVPKALFVATDRQKGEVKFDYFDMEFNQLKLRQKYKQSGNQIEKPSSFHKMVELATILSKDLPHVRVDLYEIEGKVYFSELTFFHHGGYTPFYPEEWDYTFGSWIDLERVDKV